MSDHPEECSDLPDCPGDSRPRRRRSSAQQSWVVNNSTGDFHRRLAGMCQDNFDLRLYCQSLREKAGRSAEPLLAASSNSAVYELQTEVRDLKLNIERKAALLNEGAKALKSLKADLEAALDAKSELCRALTNQEHRIEALIRENAELSMAASRMEPRLRCLEEQCSASEMRRCELERALQRSHCDVSVLQSQLGECSDKYRSLEFEYENQLRSASVDRPEPRHTGDLPTQQQLHQLRVENAGLKRHLSSAARISQAQSDCLRDENTRLVQQLQAMSQAMTSAEIYEKDNVALRAELKEWQLKFEQMRCEYENRLAQRQGKVAAAAHCCSKLSRSRMCCSNLDACAASELSRLLEQMTSAAQQVEARLNAAPDTELGRLLDALAIEPPRVPLPEFVSLLETSVDDPESVLCQMRRICDECARQIGSLRQASVKLSGQLKPWEEESLARLIASLDAQLRSLRSLTAAGAKKWLRACEDEAWELAGGSSLFAFCPTRPRSAKDRQQKAVSDAAESEAPWQSHICMLAACPSISEMMSALTSIDRSVVRRLAELDGKMNSRLTACQFYELFQQLLSDVQQVGQGFCHVFKSASMATPDGGEKADRMAVVELIREIIDDCFARLDALQEGACRLGAAGVRICEAELVSRLSACIEIDLRSQRALLAARVKAWFNLDDSEAWKIVCKKNEAPHPTAPKKLTIDDIYEMLRALKVKIKGKEDELKSDFSHSKLEELLTILATDMQAVHSGLKLLQEGGGLDEETKKKAVVDMLKQIADSCSSLLATLREKAASGEAGNLDGPISAIESVLNTLKTLIADNTTEPQQPPPQADPSKPTVDDILQIVNNLVAKIARKYDDLAADDKDNVSIKDLQDLLTMLVGDMQKIQAGMRLIGTSNTIDDKEKKRAIVKLMKRVIEIFKNLLKLIKKKGSESADSPDAATFEKLTRSLEAILGSMEAMIAGGSKNSVSR